MADYDTVITLLSALTALPLLASVLMMLSRRGKEAKDFGVILFVLAMMTVFGLIWFRRFFAWPPQVVVPTFLLSAVSSNALMVWIARSIRSHGR